MLRKKIYFAVYYVNLDILDTLNNCIFKWIELLNTNTFLNDYNLSFLIATKLVILHIINNYALSSVLVNMK